MIQCHRFSVPQWARGGGETFGIEAGRGDTKSALSGLPCHCSRALPRAWRRRRDHRRHSARRISSTKGPHQAERAPSKLGGGRSRPKNSRQNSLNCQRRPWRPAIPNQRLKNHANKHLNIPNLDFQAIALGTTGAKGSAGLGDNLMKYGFSSVQNFWCCRNGRQVDLLPLKPHNVEAK